MKKLFSAVLPLALLSSSLAFAGGPDLAPVVLVNPFQGLYIGVGGSWDSVRVDHTHLGSDAITQMVADSTIVPFSRQTDYENLLAPDIQLGYNFAWYNYIFGVAAKFDYLNFNRVLSGSGIGTIGVLTGVPGIDFTIDDQLSLLFSLGKTIGNNLFYLMGGPTWFFTESHLVDLGSIGLPNENTETVNNTPTGWIAGVGYTRYFGDHVAVDVKYTYSQAEQIFNQAVFAMGTRGDPPMPLSGLVRAKVSQVVVNTATVSVDYLFTL